MAYKHNNIPCPQDSEFIEKCEKVRVELLFYLNGRTNELLLLFLMDMVKATKLMINHQPKDNKLDQDILYEIERTFTKCSDSYKNIRNLVYNDEVLTLIRKYGDVIGVHHEIINEKF